MGTLQADAKALSQRFGAPALGEDWSRIMQSYPSISTDDMSGGALGGVRYMTQGLEQLGKSVPVDKSYNLTVSSMTSKYLHEVHAEISRAKQSDTSEETSQSIKRTTEFVNAFEQFILAHRDEIAAGVEKRKEVFPNAAVQVSASDIFSGHGFAKLQTQARDALHEVAESLKRQKVSSATTRQDAPTNVQKPASSTPDVPHH